MIAIVSSTIGPLISEKVKSLYNSEERLRQTKVTLKRLRECGFDDIYLVDNSPLLDQPQLQQLLIDFPEVKAFHLRQYQFINKGLNELMMMLFLTGQVPAGQNIFKISGRYYPVEGFKKPDFVDFAVKQHQHAGGITSVATRAYWVKDAATLERFLLWCLDELFAYPERIVGLKSLYNKLFVKKDPDNPLNISIEFAFANILKAGNYKVTLPDNMGIEGQLAGSDDEHKITE